MLKKASNPNKTKLLSCISFIWNYPKKDWRSFKCWERSLPFYPNVVLYAILILSKSLKSQINASNFVISLCCLIMLWHQPVSRNANPGTLSAKKGSHDYLFKPFGIPCGIEPAISAPEADALPTTTPPRRYWYVKILCVPCSGIVWSYLPLSLWYRVKRTAMAVPFGHGVAGKQL